MEQTLIRKGHFNRARLYHRRQELGLSLDQLAILVRCTKPSIHRWETGKNAPTPRFLRLLSDALQVNPPYFFA